MPQPPPTDASRPTAVSLARLPIFPLPDTVLLPGVALPLHIFEPRYRAMMEACIREDHLMGVATLEPGHEEESCEPSSSPGAATPDAERPPVHRVACVGLIVASERREDDTWNLVLYGTERIRIVEELPPDEPFRRVRAEVLPDRLSPEDAAAADRVRRVALEIADRVPGAGRVLGGILAQARSPAQLANLIAAHVLDPLSLRLACLETVAVAERLDRIAGALGAALLHLVGETPPESVH